MSRAVTFMSLLDPVRLESHNMLLKAEKLVHCCLTAARERRHTFTPRSYDMQVYLSPGLY